MWAKLRRRRLLEHSPDTRMALSRLGPARYGHLRVWLQTPDLSDRCNTFEMINTLYRWNAQFSPIGDGRMSCQCGACARPRSSHEGLQLNRAS